ncbi:MAG: hypothetical protein RR618_09030 [Cellulosilyticaceae bacterium]
MKSTRYKLTNTLDTTLATAHQKEYASSLGISLPENATKSDAKSLIDVLLDEDVSSPSSLIDYARHHKILCSSYIGYKYLHNLMFDNLDAIDLTAFFVYCVHQDIIREIHENLDTHRHHEVFHQFAKTYFEDFYFAESLKDYYGEELLTFGKNTIPLPDGSTRTLYGGSKQTLAYKTALSYLKENLGISPAPAADSSTPSDLPKTSFWNKLFKKN